MKNENSWGSTLLHRSHVGEGVIVGLMIGFQTRFHVISTRSTRFFCTRFFLWRQPRNFENVTSVARQRDHFWDFWAIFLVAQLPPKRGVLVNKNSLASCQRYRHSVEPRARTCPFKQSNLSAWSLLS